MSKVNLNTVITDRRGQPIKDGEADYTLRAVLFQAIDTPAEGDQTMGGATRLQLHKLGNRIAEAKTEVEFTAEEISLLIGRLDKLAFVPLVYGQAAVLLDPALASK